MFYLASTRFNNNTFYENTIFKNDNKISGIIYGSNLQINKKYEKGVLLFVFEMNNETNEIEGIGLIRNYLLTNKRYNIYSNMDYNRYIYKGDYYLSKETLVRVNEEFIKTMENILFKGKTHLKRQSGISVLTEKLLKKWDCSLDDFKEIVKNIFLSHFHLQNIEKDTTLF